MTTSTTTRLVRSKVLYPRAEETQDNREGREQAKGYSCASSTVPADEQVIQEGKKVQDCESYLDGHHPAWLPVTATEAARGDAQAKTVLAMSELTLEMKRYDGTIFLFV